MGVAVAAAVALDRRALLHSRRLATVAVALTVTLAAVVAGLLATGVSARLLPPGGWGELRGELDAGLAGVSQLDLPYAGRAEWTRLGILLAAPVTLAIAAAVAFWPSRARSRFRRALALALLIALYAVAVTWESPSAEPAHGLGLLAFVAAFLWLGRIPARRAVAAAGAVALAGLIALPAAARVSSTDPPIAYGGWKLFGDERTVTFDWDHSYGPLDWPQRGTELFEVGGVDRPLYWKTSVLDDFNGAAWSRGGDSAGVFAFSSRAERLAGASEKLVVTQDRWVETVDFSVLALRSSQLVTTGTTRTLRGVDAAPEADGTAPLIGEELLAGDSYSVTSYAPDPSAEMLKRADDGRYPQALERHTTLLLPQRSGVPGVKPEAAPVNPLAIAVTPLRGGSGSETQGLGRDIRRIVAGTPYARVRSLALRLTRGAPGNYQAVVAIRRHLLESYAYAQEVPARTHPLPAFLFRDRAGYCQQFSGAMAMMLRFAGIPSRVVTGFAPGQRDLDTGDFLVRDTDAHSWVEVWFPKVGWVTVDPTPGATPARTDATANLDVQNTGAVDGLRRAFRVDPAVQSGRVDGVTSTRGQDEGDASITSVIPLLIILAAGALGAVYSRRRRRLFAPEGAGAQLRELEGALPLLGDRHTPGTTLLAIERRLAALGPDAARYPAALRANRYRAGRPRRPGPRERRLLRRALGRGRGPRGWIRALLAIPLGGPRG